MTATRIAVFIAGAAGVAFTLGSAVKTVILPRAVTSRITRAVFGILREVFELVAGPRASFERRDRILALYAPVGLMTLVLVWLTMLLLGYWGMFWANGIQPAGRALVLSGSSLLTLGFERGEDLPNIILSFSEAVLGLVILALLISFLPTLYGTFARRELFVSRLEVPAGNPPSSEDMLVRLHRIGMPTERLDDIFESAQVWFAELGESHTSFPMLAFFRSQQPEHSWVTTAGVVLDVASLVASSLDQPGDAEVDLTIRAGYVALRRIAVVFDIPFDPDPAPGDPISISRAEFDGVVDRLAEAGVPIKADRDRAWRDFSGWRVNYDGALLGLAMLTGAPPSTWISDRGMARARGVVRRRSSGRDTGVPRG